MKMEFPDDLNNWNKNHFDSVKNVLAEEDINILVNKINKCETVDDIINIL